MRDAETRRVPIGSHVHQDDPLAAANEKALRYRRGLSFRGSLEYSAFACELCFDFRAELLPNLGEEVGRVDEDLFYAVVCDALDPNSHDAHPLTQVVYNQL